MRLGGGDGQHLDPLRRRPLHRDAAPTGRVQDLPGGRTPGGVGEHDLVDLEPRVVQRLQHGLAAVHGDELVLG